MFLKNWDMIKACEITRHAITDAYEEDKEIYCRDYTGNYAMPSLDDTFAYGGTSIYSWHNGTYLDLPDSYYYSMLWPGGDINGVPARIQPVINRDKVRYEDWNLYSPFRGGNTPGSGQIYGQPHTVTAAIYNSELDQWEKTVTREFKNESGYTITIRELGVYHDNTHVLIAREILETPIEVANDSYFKISWTYRIENPHENREVKRVRQYTDFWESFVSTKQANRYIISPRKISQSLVIRKQSIGTRENFKTLEEYQQIFALQTEGWTVKNITSFLLDDRKTVYSYNYNFFVSIDLLTPDLTENNTISMLSSNDYYSDGYYNYFSILPLTLKITNIDFIEISKKLENEHLVYNSNEEKHLIWITVGGPIDKQYEPARQLDNNFCDCAYRYNNYATSFFFDETQSQEHVFYIRNTSDQPATVVVKLQATTENDSLLYEDIPVQR